MKSFNLIWGNAFRMQELKLDYLIGVEGNGKKARAGMNSHERGELGTIKFNAVEPRFNLSHESLCLLQLISVVHHDMHP